MVIVIKNISNKKVFVSFILSRSVRELKSVPKTVSNISSIQIVKPKTKRPGVGITIARKDKR